MNRNLQDIDDLFRESLQFQEVIPSPSVRDKLKASLDKAAAESFKKRFLRWKRIAIALVVILFALSLYESGILTLRVEKSNGTIEAEKATQAAKNKNQIKRNETATVDQNNTEPVNIPKDDQLDQYVVTLRNNSAFKQPLKKNPEYASIYRESTQAAVTTSFLANSNLASNQSNRAEREHDAISRLQKNKSSATINRKPILAKVHGDLPSQQLKLLENQNKNEIGFRPHWLIGGVFAYEAAGYQLDSDLPNEVSNIKHREVHEPSYSGGVLVTRQLTFDWGLQSGLLYSKTSIGIAAQKIYAFQDPVGDLAYKYITSSGYAFIKPQTSMPSFGDSAIATEGKHTIQYVTVPLSIKYRAGKNKISFLPGVGIEANFLTGTRVETEIHTPSGKEIVFFNELHGAKSFYWSLTTDAELRYNLNNKTMLSFRPSFHHAISPITENNIVETFPYSFRWGVGLTIKL